MRLKITKSKNAQSLYVIESTYKDKKNSSRIVEKLGTYDELLVKHGRDPIEWAKEYIKELNKKEKENKQPILMEYHTNKLIPSGKQNSYLGGHLFLQQIYYTLGLDKICQDISKRHEFSFDLNKILSTLLFARVLFPSSKLSTHKLASEFIDQPNFEVQHVYRALEVIAKESNFIQDSLYKNSLKVSNRNTKILYYDCTNFFFEIEQADGLKQYGVSKEHRPNPIVQMGLFMDGDGIPLAFSINPGNTNEQVTLKPLEKKIIRDFGISKLVVCTDAGLSSKANRLYNDMGGRAFITTQSVKKLKESVAKWTFDPTGWRLVNPNKGEEKVMFDITKLDEKEYFESTFYKEQWIKDDSGFSQRMIVTYSIKYREYLRKIRDRHIKRAEKKIEIGEAVLNKKSKNSPDRFIAKTHCTEDGEKAEKTILSINQELINQEESFDGFYSLCTNLKDEAREIVGANHRRWEIEECFRIMKSEFKARPVYLRRDDRVEAHFMTCFISLIIFRLLEKKLGNKYTCHEIIDCLKKMNFLETAGENYIPTYTRSHLTDNLHEQFGCRTDYEIISKRNMKNIIKFSKTKKSTQK